MAFEQGAWSSWYSFVCAMLNQSLCNQRIQKFVQYFCADSVVLTNIEMGALMLWMLACRYDYHAQNGHQTEYFVVKLSIEGKAQDMHTRTGLARHCLLFTSESHAASHQRLRDASYISDDEMIEHASYLGRLLQSRAQLCQFGFELPQVIFRGLQTLMLLASVSRSISSMNELSKYLLHAWLICLLLRQTC